MEKILLCMSSLLLILFMAACGKNQTQATTQEAVAFNQTETQEETSTQETANSEQSETNQETSVNEESTENQEESQMQEVTKSLVVYFSCTGTTKGIAEIIAEGVGADVYEIVPVEPYTSADLNYNDNSSRSTIEMNDSSVRPEINGSVDNMEQYDTVYIGYPIWWGEAPRIVDTFVESYDFTGKTVVPFCTSGGSGVGSSDDRLKDLAGSGDWKEGHKFNGSENADTVMSWVNGL